MSVNTVAYETIQNSRNEIIASTDDLLNKIRSMEDSIFSVDWAGASAANYKQAFDNFVTERIVSGVKPALEKVFDQEMPTWLNQFEAAEAETAAETQAIPS